MQHLRYYLIIPIILCFTYFTFGQKVEKRSDLKKDLEKLKYVMEFVSEKYVDPIQSDTLTDNAIKGILSALDPHSSYTNAEETKLFLESVNGEFGGIGIRYVMIKDTLHVVDVIKGGPSEKAGVVPGDKIIKADGISISNSKLSLEEVQRILRGKKDSRLDVELKRYGVENVLTVQIKRGNITMPSVNCHYMISDRTGYLSLNRFTKTSLKECVKAIEDLKKQGMKALIFDLRNNPGGLLDTSVRLAGLFLPKGEPIVSVRNSRTSGGGEVVFRSNGSNLQVHEIDLVVLVNEQSASASEIFAGAIQDCDRGIIVGRRTFGKGLVQRPLVLPDGSMVRLTTSRYYTPSGRSIQKPYTKGKHDIYQRELWDRFEHGEFIHADSIGFVDSLKYQTINEHRTVYGGGGIMPDIFIPLDSILINNTLLDSLMSKNIITAVALEYGAAYRRELLSKYPSQSDFILFAVPPFLSKRAIAGAEADAHKNYDKNLISKSLPFINRLIKAELARNLYGTEAFYYYYNIDDPIFEKSLQILEKRLLTARSPKYPAKE